MSMSSFRPLEKRVSSKVRTATNCNHPTRHRCLSRVCPESERAESDSLRIRSQCETPGETPKFFESLQKSCPNTRLVAVLTFEDAERLLSRKVGGSSQTPDFIGNLSLGACTPDPTTRLHWFRGPGTRIAWNFSRIYCPNFRVDCYGKLEVQAISVIQNFAKFKRKKGGKRDWNGEGRA